MAFVEQQNVRVQLATYSLVTGPIPKIEVRDRLSRMHFPSFGMTGSMHQVRNVSATMTFPQFAFKGEAYYREPEPVYFFDNWAPNYTVTSDAFAFTHHRSPLLEGTLVFPAFGARIELDNPLLAEMSATFGKFSMEGRGIFPNVILDGPTFPRFGTDGEIFVPPLKVVGNMTFPQFGTSGQIAVPPVIDHAITFPQFGTSGDLQQRLELGGRLDFPRFGLSGQAIPQPAILSLSAFPPFLIEGRLELLYPRVTGGPMHFPAFGLSGRLQQPISMRGAATFPPFGMTGFLEQPQSVSGTMTFPLFGTKALIITTEGGAGGTGGPDFGGLGFEQLGNIRFGFRSDFTL